MIRGLQQEPDTVQSEQCMRKQSQLQVLLKNIKNGAVEGKEQLRDLKQPFRPNTGEGPTPKDLNIDRIYVNLEIHESRAKYDFPTER